MKQPKKPTYDQKVLISKAGLEPSEWSVTGDDESYLYLVERHFERREKKAINKETLEVTEMP